MSLTHTWFGLVVSNFWSNKFSATGKLCRESVVPLNFLFCLQCSASFLQIRLSDESPRKRHGTPNPFVGAPRCKSRGCACKPPQFPLPNDFQTAFFLLPSGGRGLLFPPVIAAPGYSKEVAQHRNRILLEPHLFDHCVSRSPPGEIRCCFFKMSRSIFTRANSRRSRASSNSVSLNGFWCRPILSRFTVRRARIQLVSVDLGSDNAELRHQLPDRPRSPISLPRPETPSCLSRSESSP